VGPIRQSRSQNRQKFFVSFFQKRRPFFRAQIHISKPAEYIQNERLGALARPGHAWMKEGRYWIACSLTTPPVINAIFHEAADIPGPF
jgi:hypothetical protein